MRSALIAICLAATAGIAHAEAARNTDPMPGAPKDECVFVRNVTNWRVLDNRHVVLFTSNRQRAYLAELGAPASDLTHAFRIAFVDRDGDGRICGRSLDKVQALGSLVPQPATIMGLTRLDDTGLQKLEAQYDVKLGRKKADEPAPDEVG